MRSARPDRVRACSWRRIDGGATSWEVCLGRVARSAATAQDEEAAECAMVGEEGAEDEERGVASGDFVKLAGSRRLEVQLRRRRCVMACVELKSGSPADWRGGALQWMRLGRVAGFEWKRCVCGRLVYGWLAQSNWAVNGRRSRASFGFMW